MPLHLCTCASPRLGCWPVVHLWCGRSRVLTRTLTTTMAWCLAVGTVVLSWWPKLVRYNRYLQDNAIATLVNGSFQGLTDLKHLYVTRPVPTAPRAWRVAQRGLGGDFIGRAHTVAT